jgi:KDO2-lipid IV(A) lauroyltransferase
VRLRHLVEYAGARAALTLLDAVPLRAALWLACRGGDLAYAADWRRRRMAQENILRSGIATERRAAARIARRSFQHFALVVVESLRSGALFQEEDWRRTVPLIIGPELEAILRDPRRGLIIASGHVGNWEISAQLISTFKPLAGVTRPMTNPYIERLVQQRKPRMQFRIIPKNDAHTTRFIDVLARGNSLGLMIDQYGGRRGLQVEFFGRPTSTHTAVALLHLITGAPICLGYSRRVGPMQFEIHAEGPLRFERTGNKEQDVRGVLERLNRELEKAIRAAPEQYLWAHRRWRPPEA